MQTAIPTSGKAVTAFLAGLLAVACGLLALTSGSDLFLAGVALFWLVAIVLGVRSRVEISRAAGRLDGQALAGWGMGLPTAGFALGFLLLPAT